MSDKEKIIVHHVHCPFCHLNKTFPFFEDAVGFGTVHVILHRRKGERVR